MELCNRSFWDRLFYCPFINPDTANRKSWLQKVSDLLFFNSGQFLITKDMYRKLMNSHSDSSFSQVNQCSFILQVSILQLQVEEFVSVPASPNMLESKPKEYRCKANTSSLHCLIWDFFFICALFAASTPKCGIRSCVAHCHSPGR